MTPVALWTGRLPGLRRLPRRAELALAIGVVALATTGPMGLLGRDGIPLGALASLAAGWIVLRHRWPSELPLRLRSLETPEGPDERAVVVEFRHDGVLLGWDVGILWFERGGVGFVGRTVSFVLPRGVMQAVPMPATLQAVLRGPQMAAKVFGTTVGILPLARALHAHTTLARLDALPTDAPVSETILPPSSLHPDLLQRGLAVRRRMPLIVAMQVVVTALAFAPIHFFGATLLESVAKLASVLALVAILPYGRVLPSAIRARLPKEPRRSRKPR